MSRSKLASIVWSSALAGSVACSSGESGNQAQAGGTSASGDAGGAGMSASLGGGGSGGNASAVGGGGSAQGGATTQPQGGAGAGGQGGSSAGAAGAGGSSEGGSGGVGGSAGAGGMAAAICPGGAYADTPLPQQGAMATTVCTDFTFTEGPVWLASSGRLLFTDFDHTDAASTFQGGVLQFEPGGECTPFAADLGVNGLALAPNGDVLAGRHLTQAIARIDAAGVATDVVTDYMGQAFSSPNDLTVRSDGTIYFSDPAWQLGNRAQELDHAVYRVDPEGNVSIAQALADRRPNGVTLSPDESKLYVSAIQPDQILVFDVASDGTLSNMQTFVDAGSDGMGIDCAGNLYTTSGDVIVYDPAGQEIGRVTLDGDSGGLPDPTNVAFGGPNRTTLFVTGANHLRSVELQIPGYPF